MISFKKHEQTIIVIALILINFVVKGLFLSGNSLGGDEPFSVYHAQMDIASIIKLLSEGNNPPLYEILLHFWIKIFGISEFSVRFPSLLFSCITVLFIYKFGVKYLNKRVALYASIIFIFSNYHILFAHEARVYAFLGMLSVISMHYFANMLFDANTRSSAAFKNRKTTNLIILIIVNTLIIYSHYLGFFVIIGQLFFLAFYWALILKHLKQVLISIAIIGLLYLPNLIVVVNRFGEVATHGTWVSPPNGIDSIYNMLRLFSNAPIVAVLVIAILLFSLVKFIVKRKKEHPTIYTRLVVVWFVFIFFSMFCVSYLLPMFMDRYLMPAAIAFCLLGGIAVDYVTKRPKYRYITPVIICLLFISTVNPNITNKRNVKETVEKIKDLKDSNTAVFMCPSNFVLNFSYYYDREIFKNYDVNDIYSNIVKALALQNVYGINNINEIDYKKWNRIVYLDAAAAFSYPDNNIRKELDVYYNLKNEYKFYEIFNVFEYEAK